MEDRNESGDCLPESQLGMKHDSWSFKEQSSGNSHRFIKTLHQLWSQQGVWQDEGLLLSETRRTRYLGVCLVGINKHWAVIFF